VYDTRWYGTAASAAIAAEAAVRQVAAIVSANLHPSSLNHAQTAQTLQPLLVPQVGLGLGGICLGPTLPFA